MNCYKLPDDEKKLFFAISILHTALVLKILIETQRILHANSKFGSILHQRSKLIQSYTPKFKVAFNSTRRL